MPDITKRGMNGAGVLVGMSGGVDSAVAALLLKEQGYHVVGVTLRLWSDPASVDHRTCRSPEAVERARRTAETLGIPHLVIDAEEPFYHGVVEYFVQEYADGRTPNPCVKCNSRVRFGLLADIARDQGLRWIATGHYARLVGEFRNLARGADRGKDQSYVLAEVSPRLLRQTLFPLGAMTKAEVKTLAARAGIVEHVAPESQEICFVPDDDHRRFLRERLGLRPGALVDRRGRRVGGHSGTYNFTIGQRKGIGIASDQPLYVVEVIAGRREVLVGTAADIAVGKITIGDIVHHTSGRSGHTVVQWRSTGGALPAFMSGVETIVLEEPATGVSPGQTAVVYDGDAVVMAGTICSTERWSGEMDSVLHTRQGGE